MRRMWLGLFMVLWSGEALVRMASDPLIWHLIWDSMNPLKFPLDQAFTQ